MIKIKVIDLLNKIANGEQPQKIKYYDTIYNFEEYKGDWGYLKWKIYKNNYNYDMSKPDRIIADKINEIIDYINKGESND